MISMIGGEMAQWTEVRPPVGGALLGYVLDQLSSPAPAAHGPAERSEPPTRSGPRVLVAGPHDLALVDALVCRATVTCLVRSQQAADELASRVPQVLCGTLAKLTDAGRYDVVVVLDGLDRLCSVEGPQLDWADSLHAVARLLRPGGTLLLTVENELGVHRLVEPTAATSAYDDGAWRVLGEFDRSKPGNPQALADLLAAEGLAVDWLGTAWPVPHAPTMLATSTALQDGPVDALAAAAAHAVGSAYAEKSVLSDPRRLAAAAVRGGVGPEFAPAWLVVAHLNPHPTNPDQDPAPGGRRPASATARPAAGGWLPPVLLGDSTIVAVAPDSAGHWLRRVVHTEPGRDHEALNGPLPDGRLLEELLLGACLRRDLAALRRLLSGWIAAAPHCAADNVVVERDTFAVLDGSVPREADVVRQFARTLIAGGYPHPWPSATGEPQLTTILRAAAGADDAAELPEVEPLPDARREREEQLRAVRRELADAMARNTWYERELGRRERELRKARLQIATFSGSLGFRVGKLGYRLARRAGNYLRKGHK